MAAFLTIVLLVILIPWIVYAFWPVLWGAAPVLLALAATSLAGKYGARPVEAATFGLLVLSLIYAAWLAVLWQRGNRR